MDNGKPFSSALGDVDEVVSVFRYYGGWADKQYGQTIAASRTKLAYTLREPVGVCGQIIPYVPCTLGLTHGSSVMLTVYTTQVELSYCYG